MRILQALLDLDTLATPNPLTEDVDIAEGAEKGLVTPALVMIVINVLANDFPILELEDVLAEYLVRMRQAVKDKSD